MVGLKQLSIIAIVVALIGTSIQMGALTLSGPTGAGDIVVWGEKVGSIDNIHSTLTSGPYEAGAPLSFSYTMDWSVHCPSPYRAVVMKIWDPAVSYSQTSTSSTSNPWQMSSPNTLLSIYQVGVGTTSSSETYTHTITSSYTDAGELYLSAYIKLRFELWDITVSPYELIDVAEFPAVTATGSTTFTTPDPEPTTGDLVVNTGTTSTVYISMTGPGGYSVTDVPASGKKTFTGLETGTYTITMVRIGYDTNTATANVLAGSSVSTAAPTWTLTTDDTEPTDPEGDPVPSDPDDDPILDPDDDAIIGPTPHDLIDGEYSWTPNAILLVAGGVVAAILMFVFLPLPPNIKAFISALIAIAAVVAAHFMNTGAI